MQMTYFLLMYQEDTAKLNMASTRVSGLLSTNEKIPVQCMDDPFGFKAEVIYGDESIPLYRCTPFLTVHSRQHMPTVYGNESSGAEVEDTHIFESLHTAESRHQMQDMSSADDRRQPNARPRPVWPEDTDAHYSRNQLTFTDGGFPLTMAMGGMGNYKPQQIESLVLPEEEEWDKNPRTRMKKGGKRGGKKSRRKQRQY
ncbi:uncharacterized protein LOC108278302 isoform X2 [Ictalurus punctatus]|uniref:Uncharacterized protein LOC108278302 isoform X2 n=1 Tax=Ictalurus punctatus TaxID=7998 RepID=A0A2D0SWJ6_ICTPU|nr:uncharacterized protein LOC108278302 isoform X2 [Ictalurus punctatus]